MTDIRYERPSYPHSNEWVMGSIKYFEGDLAPLIKSLLEALRKK